MIFINLKLHNNLMQSITTLINGVRILAITLCIRGLRLLKRRVPVDGFAMIRILKNFAFALSDLNNIKPKEEEITLLFPCRVNDVDCTYVCTERCKAAMFPPNKKSKSSKQVKKEWTKNLTYIQKVQSLIICYVQRNKL